MARPQWADYPLIRGMGLKPHLSHLKAGCGTTEVVPGYKASPKWVFAQPVKSCSDTVRTQGEVLWEAATFNLESGCGFNQSMRGVPLRRAMPVMPKTTMMAMARAK